MKHTGKYSRTGQYKLFTKLWSEMYVCVFDLNHMLELHTMIEENHMTHRREYFPLKNIMSSNFIEPK